MLTRIYGIAFDNKNELNEYLILQEETEKETIKTRTAIRIIYVPRNRARDALLVAKRPYYI